MFLIKKNKPALLRANLLFSLIIFILFFSLNLNSEENRVVLKTGNQKAKIVVKVATKNGPRKFVIFPDVAYSPK